MVAVHPVECVESKICMNAHRQNLASSKGARLICPIPGQMSTISFHGVSWGPETELRAHRRGGGDGKRRRANRDVSSRCNPPTCCMAIGKHCSTRTQNWREETHGCGENINSAIQFCQNGIWINFIYSQVRPCANLAPVHRGVEN